MTSTTLFWDRELIDNVARITVKGQISDFSLRTGGNATARVEMHYQLAQAMVAEARDRFGVEANVEDARFHEEPNRAQGGVTIRAGWWPSTLEVELVGGNADGLQFKVGDLFDVLRVPTPARFDAAVQDMSPTAPRAALDVEEYVWTRWREIERRWVFEPKEKVR